MGGDEGPSAVGLRKKERAENSARKHRKPSESFAVKTTGERCISLFMSPEHPPRRSNDLLPALNREGGQYG